MHKNQVWRTSILCQWPVAWNSLPETVHAATDLRSFKNKTRWPIISTYVSIIMFQRFYAFAPILWSTTGIMFLICLYICVCVLACPCGGIHLLAYHREPLAQCQFLSLAISTEILIYFQIKYTKAILSNSIWKLLWFEITKMLIAV